MPEPAPPHKKPAPLASALPRGAMSPAVQAEAVRRARAQAEQRVELGTRLLQAADGRLKQQQELLEAIRTEQARLRDQLQHDVAQSLQQYDQWMGHADERFTHRIDALEWRLDRIESAFTDALSRVEETLERAEALLDQPTPPASTATPDSFDKLKDRLKPE